MKCPVCAAEIPEGVTHCPDCGTEIQEVTAPSVQPSAPIPPPVESVSPPPPVVPTPTTTGVARLLLKRGGALTGDEFPISGRVIIGRFERDTGPVDIDLGNLPESAYISRRHAEIYQDESGQWFVKDLGSTNGTFVKASGSPQFQQIPKDQPFPISDGDEIAFGNVRFVFRTQ